MTSYFPLTPGFIDYQVFKIEGLWHPDTMHLDVTSRVISPINAFQRITRIPRGDITAFVFGQGGVTQTKPVKGATLYNGVDENGYGEHVNQVDMVQQPGILLLQKTITVGKVVSGTSQVIQDDADGGHTSFKFKWVNKTLAQGSWGRWPDTVRTALNEPHGGQVYNYVFADVGIVDFWFGVPNPDGTVSGYEFYAVNWA